MKILIAVSFFFFLSLPTNIFCQDIFEAPKLTIGSFWKYENDKKEEFTCRVISIKDDGYLIKTGGSYGIYSKETLNLLFPADKKGDKIEEVPSIYRKILNFPLFVGKTWEDSLHRLIRTANYTSIISYKVEGYEEAVTPSGSLKAFRVLMKVTTILLETNTQSFGEAIFWVSPEAKWWIKRDFYATRWRARSAILLKYYLNKLLGSVAICFQTPKNLRYDFHLLN